MSTKSTIRSRDGTESTTGYHLYDDWLANVEVDEENGKESPVFLQIDKVALELHTRSDGATCVTLELPRELPRELARELGILPPLPASAQSVPADPGVASGPAISGGTVNRQDETGA